MTIYRKGENQFGLHESARLGQNKLEMNRKIYKDLLNAEATPENLSKMAEMSEFMREDIARQISYEAALEDITVGQHQVQNRFMNAIGKDLGVTEDLSVPISGDDLARGAMGKKALDALKDLK